MASVTASYTNTDSSNRMSIRWLTIMFVAGLVFLVACDRPEPDTTFELFQILSKDRTGIEFNNTLKETDSLNILQYLYYYNGGGVAIGDINNDDLPDIYFSGNQVDNKLYVNLGNMKFKDVTKKAGVGCHGTWNTGVSMVDINADGLLDIYVCQVEQMGSKKGSNKLFINNGNLTFTESASKHGLDFTGLATHAAFFDYDRDGDLDCYLLNHSLKDPEQFKPAAVTRQVADDVSGDRLLQNQNGFFTDVSSTAGISSSSIGFGLGIDIGDLNRDGWPDIYIGNDFHENDYLYINNRDGTFREIITLATGHTSNFTMGVAIADINNDTWPDILSLDMKPEDETTYKLSGGWETFNIYQFKRSFGYHHQSPRNALQINQGLFNDNPVFSELACQFGIEATDWSWSPLIADFDADGYKDIFISNGIQRRPNDIDFVNYYSGAENAKKDHGLKLINRMPLGGVSNYMWSNHPETKSFDRIPVQDIGSQITNGASYSDLDRDGDLDIICNNLNHPSYIIQNNSPIGTSLSLRLKDMTENKFAVGAQITVYQFGKKQYQFLNALAGFQSAKELIAHFSIDDMEIDSIVIQWPDGSVEVKKEMFPGHYVIEKPNASSPRSPNTSRQTPYTSLVVHRENPSVDFENEKWLPFTLSTFGPRIAVGKKYYYVTNADTTGSLHLKSNNHDVSDLIRDRPPSLNRMDENDAAFADFNGDRIEDLYIAFGGNTLLSGNGFYQDQLYFGHADGTFSLTNGNLPLVDRNTSIVRPCDYDEDGDIDLFAGTLSRPGNYGWSEPGIIYVNNGKGKFSMQEMPVWEMIFDAQWSDVDLDGLQDLILVGHWMPITILYNRKTHWEKYSIPGSDGLWFSLHVTDLNQDSIPDFIAGNFGLNHQFDADPDHPMILYIQDFDLNGQSDPIMTYMRGEKRFLYPNLEFFLQQLPGRKKDFIFNKNFAGKQLNEIFPPLQLQKSIQRKCNILSSGVFFSQASNHSWSFQALPESLQHSPIWSICQFGESLFAFGGNFYNIDPNWGRQDAMLLTFMRYQKLLRWIEDGRIDKHFNRRSEIRDIKVINNKLYIASNNDTLVTIPVPISN